MNLERLRQDLHALTDREGVLYEQTPRCDIRIFELLRSIQAAIARQHATVFGDPVELSYYLYGYRRAWKDQEPRMRANRFTSVSGKRRSDA